MEYLLEIVKGILMAFGIVIGFIMCGILIAKGIKSKKNSKKNYDLDKLSNAFKTYLSDLILQEEYEEIRSVEEIITKLDKKEKPPEIDDYEIKVNTSVVLGGMKEDSDDDKTTIDLVEKYKVIGKKDSK